MAAGQPADPTDVFGTAGLRARVLAAWAASPARFREDANAEEDLVRGGYRDRVVIEVAQNAADAAARGGTPGHLELSLAGDVFTASNTGAPLDAAGVESLSTLRASSKRGEAGVGRFGAGFAAVLAVSDTPRVVSRSGGVSWDAARAAAEVARLPGLADEAQRRSGHVPVLRLPYPWAAEPEPGCTTSVVLPLRDEGARALVRRLLLDVDDVLLLALPALTEVVVTVDGDRRTVAAEGRWHVVRRSGSHRPDLLADRPVEERARAAWTLTWARPLAGQPVPPLLHAPTPTDEPLGLPALLVAPFPLDPSRRHVAPGPVTDALVAEAAAAYAELAGETEDPLALVPGPVPGGRLDGELRRAVLVALAGAPLLTTADGARVRPRDAVSVIGGGGIGERLRPVLAEVMSGLVPDHPALDRLGGRRLALADVVDRLAGLDRDPAWWRRLYDALAGPLPGDVLDALGALPVPLADGRLVRGPRGVLVPTEDLGAELSVTVSGFGLRMVHPDAVHPLLTRLGAAEATARTVLDRLEVRAVVEAAADGDPMSAWTAEGGLADTVLALVATAGVGPGELPWLAALQLADDRGEPATADELALPGSTWSVLGAGQLGAPAPALLTRFGPDVLTAAGVLGELSVVEFEDLPVDPTAADDTDEQLLPGLGDWMAAVLEQVGEPSTGVPASVRRLRAVRDLDVVSDDHWLDALVAMSSRGDVRAAVVTPVRVALPGGREASVPSYPAWWLRSNAVLQGRPTTDWAVAGAPGVAGLWEPLDAETVSAVDAEVLAAAGVRTSLAGLLASPSGADDVLGRLADPSRVVAAVDLVGCYDALSRLDPDSVRPPSRVRVRPDVVVAASEALVLDAPAHLQLDWPAPPILIGLSRAAALADVLDVRTTSELLGDPVVDGGVARPVPAAVARVLPEAPTRWWEHDDLSVADRSVSWWVDGGGRVHAATVAGLARGLSWASGRWDARLLVAALLEDESAASELVAEALLDDGGS